jgi:hypothetical protein
LLTLLRGPLISGFNPLNVSKIQTKEGYTTEKLFTVPSSVSGTAASAAVLQRNSSGRELAEALHARRTKWRKTALMKASLQHLFGSVLGILTLGISPSFAQQQLPERPALDGGARTVQANYGKLPLSFEANAGQTARDVKFLAHGPGYTVFLTSGQMVLSLRPAAGTARGHKAASAVIRLNLIDGNRNPGIVGEGPQPTRVNYFIGNDPKKWRKNVPTYKQVRYRNIYPGIDLLYYGRQSRVEHDFQIQFDVEGADQLSLASNGDLILTKNNDEIRLQAPHAYQQLHGVTVPIAAQYSMNSTRVSFTTGEYDKTAPLVIDPRISL